MISVSEIFTAGRSIIPTHISRVNCIFSFVQIAFSICKWTESNRAFIWRVSYIYLLTWCAVKTHLSRVKCQTSKFLFFHGSEMCVPDRNAWFGNSPSGAFHQICLFFFALEKLNYYILALAEFYVHNAYNSEMLPTIQQKYCINALLMFLFHFEHKKKKNHFAVQKEPEGQVACFRPIGFYR